MALHVPELRRPNPVHFHRGLPKMRKFRHRARPVSNNKPTIIIDKKSANAARQKHGMPFAAATFAATLGTLGVIPVSDAAAQVLGTAETFGVLGGSTVTNTGDTIITGLGVVPANLGVSP